MRLGKRENEGNSDKIKNAKKLQMHWHCQVFAFEAEERKIGNIRKGISNCSGLNVSPHSS